MQKKTTKHIVTKDSPLYGLIANFHEVFYLELWHEAIDVELTNMAHAHTRCLFYLFFWEAGQQLGMWTEIKSFRIIPSHDEYEEAKFYTIFINWINSQP